MGSEDPFVSPIEWFSELSKSLNFKLVSSFDRTSGNHTNPHPRLGVWGQVHSWRRRCYCVHSVITAVHQRLLAWGMHRPRATDFWKEQNFLLIEGTEGMEWERRLFEPENLWICCIFTSPTVSFKWVAWRLLPSSSHVFFWVQPERKLGQTAWNRFFSVAKIRWRFITT